MEGIIFLSSFRAITSVSNHSSCAPTNTPIRCSSTWKSPFLKWIVHEKQFRASMMHEGTPSDWAPPQLQKLCVPSFISGLSGLVIDEAFLHVRVVLSRPLWTCPSSPGCKWHRRSEMNDPAAASHRVKTLNAASESVAASPRSGGTCPSSSAWGPSELWPSLRGLARRRRCFSLSPRLSCLPFSGRVSWARPGWRSRRCSPLPACGLLCQTCCRG